MNSVSLYKIDSSCNSISQLIRSNAHLIFLIRKNQERQLEAYIGLNEPDEEQRLRAAGISVSNQVLLHLKPGGLRIVRTRNRCKTPIAPGSGRYCLSALEREFTFNNTIRTLRDSDDCEYVYLELCPSTLSRVRNTYDDATNLLMGNGAAYSFLLLASSNEVANAIISDINASGCLFQTTRDDDFPPNKISPVLMAQGEALITAESIDHHLLASMCGADINAYMDPAKNTSPHPDIVLGYSSGIPVGLELKDILRNLSVLGLVGSGKTYLLSSIVKQLSSAHIPCIVLAPIKQDFSEAFPNADLFRAGSTEHPLRFNLLDLPRKEFFTSAHIASKSLANLVSMGDDDSVLPTVLQNALFGLYAGMDDLTLSNLAEAVKSELSKSSYDQKITADLTQAMLTRLKNTASLPEFDCTQNNLDIPSLFEPGKISVIELNDLSSDMRKAFATIFMERLRRYILSLPNIGRDSVRACLVIDETHELLSVGFRDILNDTLNTCGGKSVGVVFADQRIELMGDLSLYGSSSTMLLRNLPSATAASILHLPEDSPLLMMSHKFRPGEGLLSVSGEDTIAINALPLPEKNSETALLPKRKTVAYCPYEACKAVCCNCNLLVKKIASRAVTSLLYGNDPFYESYRTAGPAYDQKFALYEAACKAHQRDPKSTVEPRKICSKTEFIQHTKDGLFKACLVRAVSLAREASDLNLSDNDDLLYHCVSLELDRQLAFRIIAQ